MKKIITGFILMFVATVALAIPSPKMIEEALMTRHYAEAKGMVAGVLREKPDSARAHLLNAYILAHVDKNAQAANAELTAVNGLDKKGDVKNSPLYGRVVAEVQMMKPVAPVRQAVVQAAPAYKPVAVSAVAVPVTSTVPVQHSKYDFGNYIAIFFAVLMLGLICFLLYLAFRQEKQVVTIVRNSDDDFYASRRNTAAPAAPSSGGVYYENLSRAGNVNAPSRRYEQPSERIVERTIVQQPVMASGGAMGTGMGAFGTAASVAGGVVAGNMLSDALHHGHRSHNSSYEDEEYERRREREQRQIEEQGWQASSPVYQPAPEPAVSYETERRSFSSGSDDSWSSSSSSSSFSSSDSGSSSWDSGSDSSSSSSWD